MSSDDVFAPSPHVGSAAPTARSEVITWRQDASYNWQGVSAKGERCAVTRIINEGYVTSWVSQYDGSINVSAFIEKSADEAKSLLERLFDYADEELDEPRGLSAAEEPCSERVTNIDPYATYDPKGEGK